MNAPLTMIAQADPGAGYRALKPEIDAAVARALNSGWCGRFQLQKSEISLATSGIGGTVSDRSILPGPSQASCLVIFLC
jgi:hypothetical protein